MPQTSALAHWADATNLEFWELLATFSSQNAGVIPPTSTYVQLIAIISSKHRTIFTVKQLCSRYQRFRKDCVLFTSVKSDFGLGWDDALQNVTCEE